MILRIVRMEFQEGTEKQFKELFALQREKLLKFPGCYEVKLYRDVDNSRVFYTYSLWENKNALENYRNSEVFLSVWKKVKKLFAGKPVAYSLLQEKV